MHDASDDATYGPTTTTAAATSVLPTSNAASATPTTDNACGLSWSMHAAVYACMYGSTSTATSSSTNSYDAADAYALRTHATASNGSSHVHADVSANVSTSMVWS